jgi:hypothetical protein
MLPVLPMLPVANVANSQFIRRLVHRSISEGGSLGEGGLVLDIGIGNISTLATFPHPDRRSLGEGGWQYSFVNVLR